MFPNLFSKYYIKLKYSLNKLNYQINNLANPELWKPVFDNEKKIIKIEAIKL